MAEIGAMADPTAMRVELPTGTVALAGSTVIGGGVGLGAPGLAGVAAAAGVAGAPGAPGVAVGDGDGEGDAGICAAGGATKHAVRSVSDAKKRESVSLGSNFAGAVDGRC